MNFNLLKILSAMAMAWLCLVIPIQTQTVESTHRINGQNVTSTRKMNTPEYNLIAGLKNLVFHRASATYFMIGHHAMETTHGNCYNISNEGVGGSDLVSIKIPPTSSSANLFITYLTISKGELEVGHFLERSFFELIPVRASPHEFTLLVTPSSRPPFSFYKQEFYPTETPAELSVEIYELNIEESYRGQRLNIMKTAKLVKESNLVNKTMAYEELLELMTKYKHIQGKDIFEIGQYILDDLGVNATLFQRLPRTVQLLIGSKPLTLHYKQMETNLTFPMKYHWASDLHENILSYAFDFNSRLQKWAITYAGAHQLYTHRVSSITQVLSTNKHFIFKLYLSKDLKSFRVLICGNRNNCLFGDRTGYTPIISDSRKPDFYFSLPCSSDYTGELAEFIVEEYTNVQ